MVTINDVMTLTFKEIPSLNFFATFVQWVWRYNPIAIYELITLKMATWWGVVKTTVTRFFGIFLISSVNSNNE